MDILDMILVSLMTSTMVVVTLATFYYILNKILEKSIEDEKKELRESLEQLFNNLDDEDSLGRPKVSKTTNTKH